MISLLQTLKNILQKPFSKKIEFSLMEKFTIEDLLDQSNFWLSPISAMKRIPDWYKEMKTFNFYSW